jgi:hypothetical protein
MQCKQAKPRIASIVAGMPLLIMLALVMLTFTMPHAKATPQLANGKPCDTCHTGSPPSKANVKK